MVRRRRARGCHGPVACVPRRPPAPPGDGRRPRPGCPERRGRPGRPLRPDRRTDARSRRSPLLLVRPHGPPRGSRSQAHQGRRRRGRPRCRDRLVAFRRDAQRSRGRRPHCCQPRRRSDSPRPLCLRHARHPSRSRAHREPQPRDAERRQVLSRRLQDAPGRGGRRLRSLRNRIRDRARGSPRQAPPH